MPELAEVEYHRRQWEGFLGSKVLGVDLHADARVFRGSPAALCGPGLVGRVFRYSVSHGKQIFLQFSMGCWVRVHLGMTGGLRVEARDFQAGRHDHWVLRLRKASLVFHDPRMFGGVAVLPSTENPLAALPPAVDSPDFSLARVEDAMGRRKSAPIKSLLLDQNAFPGVGNWMADEILWRCHIHPATPIAEISPPAARRIWRETVHVAGVAMEVIAPSWGELPDHWLMNHRWEPGKLCPRPSCQTPLGRETIAGRTTCWCPCCQK